MQLRRKISLLLSFVLILNTCVFADSGTLPEGANSGGTDIVATPSAIDIVPSGISIDMSLSNSEDIDDMLISTNYTLEENENVDNLTLNGGTLDLNGYTLTIYGSLQQNGGTLQVNGGNLIIINDYSIGNVNNSPDAYLNMTNTNDYVFVGGNFFFNAFYPHDALLTAGLIEIQGDFSQRSSNTWTRANNFYASGTHKVLFSGKSEQTISFDDPTSSKMNILESSNIQGLNCSTYIGVSYIQGSNTVFDNLSLSSETTILDNITITNLNINNQTFYSNGNTLNISGDVNVYNGTLSVSGGRLNVGGNFNIGTETDSPSAYLKMTNPSDYILVEGDFFTNAFYPHVDLLTEGVLEIKGNFTQKSSNTWTRTNNFFASDNHKTILSGSGEQTICFEDPTASKFNILETTNPNVRTNNFYATENHKTIFSGTEEQVISFEDPLNSKFNKLETQNPYVTCATDIGVSYITGNNTAFNDLKVSSDCQVLNDFITNTFTLDAGTFDLNSKNIIVNNDTQLNAGVG